MRRIVLLRDATRELGEAARWYETRERGLGQDLLTRVKIKLTRVAETPEIYQQWEKGRPYRRAAVSRFPFVIFYVADAETVYVYAVAQAWLLAWQKTRPLASRLLSVC